ncbi:hypothetical protein ACUN3I_20005 [Hafnia alvei]|uniref:hypothetical protein n=1 Tax=Hafnia alvei TaxID=569 RepID=UPI0040442793
MFLKHSFSRDGEFICTAIFGIIIFIMAGFIILPSVDLMLVGFFREPSDAKIQNAR